MEPTIGRIVHYRLTQVDVDRVVGRHQSRAGDVVPLVVVRVWPDEYRFVEQGVGSVLNVEDGGPLLLESAVGLNGQAILDGQAVAWITSASHGPGPGQWSWPPRV